MLYGQLSSGRIKIGRPRFRYKDVCKPTLKDLIISTITWEDTGCRPRTMEVQSGSKFPCNQHLSSSANYVAGGAKQELKGIVKHEAKTQHFFPVVRPSDTAKWAIYKATG